MKGVPHGKTKKPKPPFALRALAAFAVTLTALFVLLLAAYALPGEPVRDHVYDSAVKIAGEGLYPEYLNFKLFQMDNYTDTIMLTEAVSADEAPPLTAMMTNTAYNVDNFETLADDLLRRGRGCLPAGEADKVAAEAKAAGVPVVRLGTVGGGIQEPHVKLDVRPVVGRSASQLAHDEVCYEQRLVYRRSRQAN